MLQPAHGLIFSTGSCRSVCQHVQQDVMLIQPAFDSVAQHLKAILSSAVGWTGLKAAAHKIKSTFSACLTSSGFCSVSSSTSSYCPLLRTQAAVLSTGDIVAESTGDWTWSRDTCEHFKRNYIQIYSKIHFIWRRKMTMKLPVSKNPPNLLQRSFILPWLWSHNTYLSPSKSKVPRKFPFLSKQASLWESSCFQILFASPLSPLPDFRWGFLNLWFLSQRKQSDKASLAACSGKTNWFIWSAEELKVEQLSQPGHRHTLQWKMGLRGLDTRWHSGTSKRCNITMSCLSDLNGLSQQIHPDEAVRGIQGQQCLLEVKNLIRGYPLFKGSWKGSQEKKQETLCPAGENTACYKFQAIFMDKGKFISTGISIITPERATLS